MYLLISKSGRIAFRLSSTCGVTAGIPFRSMKESECTVLRMFSKEYSVSNSHLVSSKCSITLLVDVNFINV